LQRGCSTAGLFTQPRQLVYVLGDLVNRGPESLAVLRRLMRWALLPAACWATTTCTCWPWPPGVRPGRTATTRWTSILMRRTDRAALLDWLRHQRMALHEVAHGRC
jgi:bis(5'-nucleosyl)-tetraphosphatase (symmetrical)